MAPKKTDKTQDEQAQPDVLPTQGGAGPSDTKEDLERAREESRRQNED